ncbi:MAG: deoxyribose-phosphate aldolase [Saprospiraceae bacterium]|jgi:deoxyribose-phosphate aldolase
MKINQYIDHTNLKPTATQEDIKLLCKEATENDFYAVCIAPYYLDTAKKEILKSNVKLSTVIGFPFGYDHVATKMMAISKAINGGADELDIVINLSAVKNKDWATVENEIDSITTVTKLKGNKVLKLILETAYLNREELELLCNLCIKCNVDFAKTSTGYAPTGAQLEDVLFMKSILGDKVAIKASGGINDSAFAKQLIEAGATRLGSSSGRKLLI